MAYVIKIEADTQEPDSEHAGRFVSRYDPDAHDGLGHVWTVAEPRKARQFATNAAAVEFWRQPSTIKPLREDGKPNRPLTAFTVSIFDWEKACVDLLKETQERGQ
jgi:hypothetical protein